MSDYDRMQLENVKLRKRVAELEAEVAELRERLDDIADAGKELDTLT